MKKLIVMLALLSGCGDECKCEPPQSWKAAWKLESCSVEEGVEYCMYSRSQDWCRYELRRKDECSWIQERFFC